MMGKIHPNPSMITPNSHYSTEKEIITVWMKSLLFNGKGCTVFNSNGEIVLRVDNYQTRRRSNVFLMDSNGKVLFSLSRKKLQILGCWEGFKWTDSKVRRWFEVRRDYSIFSRDISRKVTVGGFDKYSRRCCYKIVGSKQKLELKIMDFSGKILAETIEKQSVGGVPLGDDVLTLMVGFGVDHSLMMAIIVVYGLINDKL